MHFTLMFALIKSKEFSGGGYWELQWKEYLQLLNVIKMLLSMLIFVV